MRKAIILITLLSFFTLVACDQLTTTTPLTTTTATATTASTSQTTSQTTTTLTTTTEATTTTAATTTQTTTTIPTTTPTTTTVYNAEPTIVGVSDKTVNRTAAFDPLAGITASDAEDGDLTAIIVVDSNVDVSVDGSYTVTLSVTDAGGKTATVTYTVAVVVSSNETKALADLAAINFAPDTTLPNGGTNGSIYTWTSSLPDVMTNKGLTIPLPVGSDPVDVTMTLKIVNGWFTMYHEFTTTVQPSPEVAVTRSVMLPFDGTSTEYVVPDQEAIRVFYVNNGTVPYIDVETFVNMVDGALDASIIEFTPVDDDVLVISYTVEYEDFDGTLVQETYSATIDFTENTFTVSSFDFFEGYVASTESDYGEGLNYVDADYGAGAEVTIPLGFYRFDIIVYHEGEETFYLMPVAVTDLLLLGGVYYDVYYNGDKLWGVDTFGLSGGTAEDLAIHEAMRTSSLAPQTMATDMNWATYNYLALAMDYFYGLKDDLGYETFYDVLLEHVSTIMTKGDTTVYKKIFDIVYDLDDLHSWHVYPGYYVDPTGYSIDVTITDLGPDSYSFYRGLWAVQDLLDAKYGSYTSMPAMELLDDEKIAVIHLTGFTIDTPDEFKRILDHLPATVTSVVVDLSYNTGGNLGAVLRIFGYMTENQIMYHSKNPADGATVTYYIESDYVAFDYDWYILCSSVTFSAANLMTSIAKEQGIATVIGQPSSGGASSIGVIITPDGSVLFISTNNVLCTRIGNEIDGYVYQSIEDGITPDYLMDDVTSNSELIALIHSLQPAN
ncbi:MAG: S41 family peptidase [Candidatus Izemoplasmatales bacterium]